MKINRIVNHIYTKSKRVLSYDYFVRRIPNINILGIIPSIEGRTLYDSSAINLLNNDPAHFTGRCYISGYNFPLYGIKSIDEQ